MDARKNLIVDGVALLVYLVAANPALTGIGVHEWLGLGVFAVLVVHCAAHVDAVADVVRNTASDIAPGRIANLVLDALILIVFVVVMVSGLGVSGDVLRTFGLYADGYYLWAPLHSVAAKILLALLLVHVVAHAKWLYNFAKGRGFADKAGKRKADERDG